MRLRCLYIGLGLMIGFLMACSTPPQFDTSKTVRFEAGTPQFDVEAIAFFTKGTTGLDLYVQLSNTSLIFTKNGTGYKAACEITVQLKDETGANVHTETWQETIAVASYAETNFIHATNLKRHLTAPAGRYRIDVIVEDLSSSQMASRSQWVDVPSPETNPHILSRILIEAKTMTRPFEPVAAWNLAQDIDSLRAAITLYNAPAEIEVQMDLIRFLSDSLPSVVPHLIGLNYLSRRVAQRGIDYDRGYQIQSTRRVLNDPSDVLTFAFQLPPLSEGNYRVMVRILGQNDATETTVLLNQHRDFSIKPPGFPYITDLNEMISALTYIADDEELARMFTAPTPEAKRAAFDTFWGASMPNRETAANTIKHYYLRIEEANKRFSSHKAGWKTDRGMIYVLMGPPNFVRRQSTTGEIVEVWDYSRPNDFQAREVHFQRMYSYEASVPFEQYRLTVLPETEFWYWETLIERWRSGEVL